MEAPLINAKVRESLSVIAYLHIMFDQPEDAARLLLVLDRLDPASRWARHAHCLALLQAARYEEAADEASRLLEQPLDDESRFPVLRILVKACWKLGRKDEARAHQRLITSILAETVLPRGRSL